MTGRYAVTFHVSQKKYEDDESVEQTYPQFWKFVKSTLKECGFVPSGNRSVYRSTDDNLDPVNKAKEFTVKLYDKYPTMCDYVTHLFLVNLDDNYNLLEDPCGCGEFIDDQ